MKKSCAHGRPVYANAASTAALVLAMAGLVGGGAAYAAESAKASKPKVGSAQIKKNAVTRAKIAPKAVDGRRVADGSLRGLDIADGSIGLADLAPGLIGGQGPGGPLTVPDGSLTGAKITDGSLTGVDIAADSIAGTHIAPGAVGALDLANGSVGANAIASGSVSANAIANGTITAAKIQNDTLGPDQINEGLLGPVKRAAQAGVAESLEDSLYAAATVTSAGQLVGADSFGFVDRAEFIRTGQYVVLFDHSLNDCAVTGSVISRTPVDLGSIFTVNDGTLTVAPVQGFPNAVLVQTADATSGAIGNFDFALNVMCDGPG